MQTELKYRFLERKKLFNFYLLVQRFESILPASKYMTPVTRIALICRWHIPNDPNRAAEPKMIKHTNEHDIDKLCIPKIHIEFQMNYKRT